MEQELKNILINICVIISIIIIIRFIYLYFKSNNGANSKEGFESGPAEDLLTKMKSEKVYSQMDTIASTNNPEQQIPPWTNQLYNIQATTTRQIKPIAFYKPQLFIEGTPYCKLGDMVSQSPTYEPPTTNEFTLLIKKLGSDIKEPIGYELVVDVGDKNTNPKYYEYNKYIGSVKNLGTIINNISTYTNSIVSLNGLVTKNSRTIKQGMLAYVQNNARLYVVDGAAGNIITDFNLDNTFGTRTQRYSYSITDLLKLVSDSDGIFTTANKSSIDALAIPAGMKLSINGAHLNNDGRNSVITLDISVPSRIDTIPNKKMAMSFLPSSYSNKNIKEENINYKIFKDKMFKYVSVKQIVDYLMGFCTNTQQILDNINNDANIIGQLKLPSSTNVSSIVSILTEFKNDETRYVDVQITELSSDTNLTPLSFISDNLATYKNNTDLLGKILTLIDNNEIQYKLTYVVFKPSMINFTDNFVLNVSGFNNTIDIPLPFLSIMNKITDTANIISFKDFIENVKNNKINLFPLQIYRPIAPVGYVSLGHIYCFKKDDLDYIKSARNVVCVPENCTKEMGTWQASDKVYEYNIGGKYFAIYFNKYTGTFISTNQQKVPEGKILKVVACVKKCTIVDDLKKSDECARKYYDINKKLESDTQLVSNIVNDKEEEYYLAKIKAQNESMAFLKQRAQKMQSTMDKATIINREMNKNKLQNYVDTQKRNIELVADRLIQDRNKVSVDINMTLETLNKIVAAIKNMNISKDKKDSLLGKVYTLQKDSNAGLLTKDEMNKAVDNIIKSCPEYDLSGLVKKSVVADVCYGCDNP
jgi:hypothetical protein